MIQKFRNTAKVALVLIYLVIIAGAVVRMTGSGMGCPDWPKCFGYYIPPTDASEIQFQANHEYKKGYVIQIDEIFYYAKSAPFFTAEISRFFTVIISFFTVKIEFFTVEIEFFIVEIEFFTVKF